MWRLWIAGLVWAQMTSPGRAFVRMTQAPFVHGVASGDPLQDRVVLWTRVTPPQNWTQPISVRWEVAEDRNFSRIIASGNTTTDASRDYTVKVDATGLVAGRWYYYRFQALDAYSPVGRTRTLPDGNPSRLRLAILSCSDYQAGFFNAYENLCLRNDIDLILHLGDYIYEYGPQNNRPRQSEPPREIVTLSDYRIRYSHYRLDSSLQWVHQNFPFITIWDDHELANNAWREGAENHSPSEGSFAGRRAAMLRAYHEWMPFRMQDPSDSLRIWRQFRWGNLAEIFMLDTRHYARDSQLSRLPLNANDPRLNDPNRTLLGTAQREWLLQGLKTSPATWKLIGQQVMIAPLRFTPFGTTLILNPDQWDGYAYERRRIMDTILSNNIQNIAFFTGDIHTSWGNDLPFGSGSYDPNTGAGSVAVEFVTPSITALNPDFLSGLGGSVQSQNRHIKYLNLSDHGYVLIDVTPNRVQGDWYFVQTINQPQPGERAGESWYVQQRERFLRRASAPTSAPSNYNPPVIPRGFTASLSQGHPVYLLGVYPNPVQNEVILQIYTRGATSLSVKLYTLAGNLITSEQFSAEELGTNYYFVSTEKVPAGLFLLVLEDGKGWRQTYRIVKE
ncbi:MAG: alkaline phosphatase D family protein [Bacteroidia bacterium]|nr:alkaline phosphatase D family protein [Bacteroidia bacterium]